MEQYFNVIASGLMSGVLFGLISMGFGLFYWVTKLFHLAYGSIFTFSAYVAYQVAVRWELGIFAGFVIGSIAAALLGVLVDTAVYRPLSNRGVDRHMILVAGLGTDAIIMASCLLLWGGLLRYYPPTPLEDVITLGSVTVTWLQLMGVAGSLIAFFLLRWMLTNTMIGKSSRAMAADPEIAIVVGVSPPRVRLVIAAVTAIVAAWAAIFQTISLGVHSGMGLPVLIMAASGALLGGQNKLFAAFLAGTMLGVLQNVGSFIIGSQWKNSIALMILLIVLAVRSWRITYHPKRTLRNKNSHNIPA